MIIVATNLDDRFYPILTILFYIQTFSVSFLFIYIYIYNYFYRLSCSENIKTLFIFCIRIKYKAVLRRDRDRFSRTPRRLVAVSGRFFVLCLYATRILEKIIPFHIHINTSHAIYSHKFIIQISFFPSFFLPFSYHDSIYISL